MQAQRILAAVCVVSALSAPLAANAAEPRIEFEKYELPNGLDVILHEDHSVPIVSINIWYHVGSKNEKPGRTGFAHLFEHMMFQGSQHFADEFFEPFDKIGGNVNGSTNTDRTNYWEDVPSNYLETVLWLEADRMGYLLPAMTQEKLDNQRDVVKNERRQGLENSPYQKVEEILPAALYPADHPYSWITLGSMDDLSAASLDDVGGFFKTYYTPNNASLCIAGDFDPAAAKALVAKYLGPIPPGPAIDRLRRSIPKLASEKLVTTEDDVSLSRIYLVWHTPPVYEPGDAEFNLLAEILAGGKTSRLYKALVYEQGIAQDVSAFQASAEAGSTFRITVTAREGKSLDEIKAAVDAEIARLFKKGVSKQELEEAYRVTESGLIGALQETGGFGGIADRLNDYNTMRGDPGGFAWDLARHRAVTPASILAEAQRWLGFDNRVALSVFPRGSLEAAEGEALHWAALPVAAPEPTFTPPSIVTDRLENGLEILVVENHDLPLVSAELVIKSGWAADPVGRMGAGSLTAALLDEGTRKRDALAITEDVRALGATLETDGSFDASSVQLGILKDRLAAGLEIMADVARNPQFPEEEIERQRAIMLGRIAQHGKDPILSALNTFLRELYGKNHPYGQPFTGTGTEASVRAITRDDLSAYYAANYVPNNAALIFVGDVTPAEAREEAQRAFGEWKPGQAVVAAVPQTGAPAATRVVIVDRPGAPQSVIIAGHLALARNDERYDAFQVVNTVFGGEFTSRLNMNLREEKGYTYGAGSFTIGMRGVGPIACYAPVQSQNTKESVAEIVKEFRAVVGDRPLTDQEISESRDGLVKGFPQAFQTNEGVRVRAADLVAYGLPLDEWQGYMKKIRGITGAQAAKTAREILRPDALLIVVVGDRAKIEAGLRELKVGEVVVAQPEAS